MALTKIGKEGITGISNASDATFLTATSAEGVTLAGTLAVTGVHTVGTNAVATSDGGAVTTSVIQGLIKVFFYKESDGASYGDSFNTSALTDTGTGDFTVVFANNFANSKYGSGNNNTLAHESQGASSGVQSVDYNAGYARFKSYQNGGIGDAIVNGNFAGDLA